MSAGAMGCGPAPASATAAASALPDAKAIERAVATLLDDWHDAAAHADEGRYFGHLAKDAIFLGTDAKERWTKEEFLAFAHPFFARGKAWSFQAIERHVMVSTDGAFVWFDEALATPNLGPARGSGVLRREGASGPYRIVHYDLALTVPNEKLDAVKKALAATP